MALFLCFFIGLSGIFHWGIVLRSRIDSDKIPIITRYLFGAAEQAWF